MKHDEKGDTITPDMTVDDVDTDDYDALLLPGGVANPDTLRMNDRAVEIVGEFMDDDKIVAAICHGPWLLAEADVVDGETVTRGRRSAPTWRMPAPTWSTRRSWSTAI